MSKIGGIEMGLPLFLTSTVLKSLATIFDEPLRRMEGYELCKLAFERKDHKEAVRLLRLQDPIVGYLTSLACFIYASSFCESRLVRGYKS